MKPRLIIAISIAFLIALSTATAVARGTSEVDISGTWQFAVELEDGQRGDPTFVFKQDKGKLTGSYKGPLGEQQVTGTVTENKAVFGFEFTRDGNDLKATYTATIESAAKMTGIVEFSGGTRGKWTATKK
jgi:hypothetical protein